ncbi:uncharacterized protein LOC131649938 [Vicia villosa]|uniref:uncharacterized protein LOC131649938 n=1 Tax=Vicia villosa TaxID=3911 RepID=UPI00273C8BB6|nr:uncharacterized protein LOC131649938 [Vicia villosa]
MNVYSGSLLHKPDIPVVGVQVLLLYQPDNPVLVFRFGMCPHLMICDVNQTWTDTSYAFVTGKRGRSDKLIFGYDRGGKYKEGDSKTQSASKKCGRPFKIRSTPSKNGSRWKIDVKCGVHNHGLPDRFEVHTFVSRLNADDQQHIVDLTKRHVPPRHILLSLQERDPKNVTQITQIYKYKSKIYKDIRGPRMEMQQLFKLVEESGYVY